MEARGSEAAYEPDDLGSAYLRHVWNRCFSVKVELVGVTTAMVFVDHVPGSPTTAICNLGILHSDVHFVLAQTATGIYADGD